LQHWLAGTSESVRRTRERGIPDMAHFNAASSWLALRRATAQTLWPELGGDLPRNHTPTAIKPVAGFPTMANLTWNTTCEHFWLSSTVYHFRRKEGVKSKDVIIHHHGHAAGCDRTPPDSRCDGSRSFFDFYNVTEYYSDTLKLDAFFMYMPLFGPNMQQGLPVDHGWFEQWQDKGTPTIKFFLQPVILTINYALHAGYDRVVMIGKSGGGWTATLAAALDPRIYLSFPIAGAIPLDMRVHHPGGPSDVGDFEQRPRETSDRLWYLNAANYTQLFGLATLDERGARTRASVQVLHEDDPCCFGGKIPGTSISRHNAFLDHNRALAAELPRSGPGIFTTTITNWNVHAVCQMDRVVMRVAKEQIDLHRNGSEAPDLGALPCDILQAPQVPCPIAPPGATAVESD